MRSRNNAVEYTATFSRACSAQYRRSGTAFLWFELNYSTDLDCGLYSTFHNNIMHMFTSITMLHFIRIIKEHCTHSLKITQVAYVCDRVQTEMQVMIYHTSINCGTNL